MRLWCLLTCILLESIMFVLLRPDLLIPLITALCSESETIFLIIPTLQLRADFQCDRAVKVSAWRTETTSAPIADESPSILKRHQH